MNLSVLQLSADLRFTLVAVFNPLFAAFETLQSLILSSFNTCLNLLRSFPFPPAWQLYLHDPFSIVSTIPLLHISKPSQPQLFNFVSNLSCPANILISKPVHPSDSQEKSYHFISAPSISTFCVFVSTLVFQIIWLISLIETINFIYSTLLPELRTEQVAMITLTFFYLL